jgi:hypothetical protein
MKYFLWIFFLRLINRKNHKLKLIDNNNEKQGKDFNVGIQIGSDIFFISIFKLILYKIKILHPNIKYHFLYSNHYYGMGYFQSKKNLILKYLINFFVGVEKNSISILSKKNDSMNYLNDIEELCKIFKKDYRANLYYSEIKINDLLIDTYLRYSNKYEFNPTDQELKSLIKSCIEIVINAEKALLDNNLNILYTCYASYIESGILVRLAIKHSIVVVSFGNLGLFGKKLSSTNYFHTFPIVKKENFSKLSAVQLENSRLELNKRFSGEIDFATKYMSKSAYSSRSEIVTENLAGCVVIYLHDFYDSPNVYGGMFFLDFWNWITFTIETLLANQIKFVIKPHPNALPINKIPIENIRSTYHNVIILDHKINTVQLVEAGIKCGITVYGTISLELGFLGIKSIISADSPYKEMSFVKHCSDLIEYRSELIKLKEYSPNHSELKFFKEDAIKCYSVLDQSFDNELRVIYHNLWRVTRILNRTKIPKEIIFYDSEFQKILTNLENCKAFNELIKKNIAFIL